MREQHRSLAHMLVSEIHAREAESARVSRVLHDDVGQVLSAVGLQLMVMRMDLQEQAPEIVPRTLEIQQMLEQAVERVRKLSYELHSAVVERAGLQFALDRLVGLFRDGFGGTLRYQYDPGIHLPLDVATGMHKIAERALDNAIRHSQARQVDVSVRSTQSGVRLEVRDDGVGFAPADPSLPPHGLGLLLMQFDAERLGLDLAVRSAVGKGTAVRVTYAPAAQRPEKETQEGDPARGPSRRAE